MKYEAPPQVEDALRHVLASTDRCKGFGNGRLMRNLFEAAVANHADRVAEIDNPSRDDLVTFAEADIAVRAT